MRRVTPSRGQFVSSSRPKRNWTQKGPAYVFDLDIRDYNLWIREEMPVILVLFDATRKRAFWLAMQRYFQNNAARKPKKGARSVRIRVPKRQAVNRRAIAKIRDLKCSMLRHKPGEKE
jgi:hypothetical protein